MTEQFVDRKKLSDTFLKVASHVVLQEKNRTLSQGQHNYKTSGMASNLFSWDSDHEEVTVTGNIKPTSKSISQTQAEGYIALTSIEGEFHDLRIMSFENAGEENETETTLLHYDVDKDGKNITIEKAQELCMAFADALSSISCFEFEEVMDLIDGTTPTIHDRAQKLAANLC